MYIIFLGSKILCVILFCIFVKLKEVVEFVRHRISNGINPEDICEDLMTRCLAPNGQMGGLGCDNMTVVIVCFLGDGTWNDLQIQCSKNAAPKSKSPSSSPKSKSPNSSPTPSHKPWH